MEAIRCPCCVSLERKDREGNLDIKDMTLLPERGKRKHTPIYACEACDGGTVELALSQDN